MSKQEKKAVWLISKYCRLPSQLVHYSDHFQIPGAYPARGFSILRCLSRRQFDCTVIHARHGLLMAQGDRIPSREVSYIDDVRVVSLCIPPYKRAQSAARIFGWIFFELKLFFMKTSDLPRPDYIVASSLSLLSVLNGLILKWRFKSKLIFEVRDIWPLLLVENGGFSKHNPFVMLLQLVEWMGYKYADAIVATMPNLGPHVENVLGYPRSVNCVPMGIPEEMLDQKKLPLPEDLQRVFIPGKFIVTYVGSIGVDNALDTLFEAARILQNESQIIFRIFGSGDLLDKYKSECSDLKHVFFGGAIPPAMVQSVLEKSSILYFATHPSSVLDYGQSLNKIIDYMYSARPILASHSGYKSMLNEARCGYFITAGDSDALSREISRLSKYSRAELDDMGARGRDWLFEHRSYDNLATKYEMILGGDLNTK